MPADHSRHRARLTAVSVLLTAACVLLFGYTLRTVGLSEIAAGLARVGPLGFGAVLGLSGVRLVVRALAWMRCVEGDRPLTFRRAFAASVMGEALGNITPFATLVSEPAKAMFVRQEVPIPVALAAIVVENIVYSATVALMIIVGALAFLLVFPASPMLRAGSLAAVVAMAVIVAASWLVLRAHAKPLGTVIDWLGRRGLAEGRLAPYLARGRRFEAQINSFTDRNRQRLPALGFYEAAFHLAGVAEVYVTIALVAPDSVTFVKALILEAVGRVINVMFKFIPMRFGVDEAGNALLAKPLALPVASLVTLPLVRKARILVWTAVGVLWLVARGVSIRGALREAAGRADVTLTARSR